MRWNDRYRGLWPQNHFFGHVKGEKDGLASAKNFGINCINNVKPVDWIAYLDADDQWMHAKLEVQRNFMLDNPEVDFCFTECWDHENGVLKPNCFPIGKYNTHEQIEGRIYQENCLGHGSAMIRMEAMNALGGYNTDKRYLGREDWELWQRAIANGYRFAKVPERLYCYSMGTSVAR